MTKQLSVLAVVTAACLALPAHAADADAAQALAKKSGCMKCHSVAAKKEGPSFKDVAAKYKGKADAEQMLVAKLTSGKGHPATKASAADVKSIVQWVLAQ